MGSTAGFSTECTEVIATPPTPESQLEYTELNAPTSTPATVLWVMDTSEDFGHIFVGESRDSEIQFFCDICFCAVFIFSLAMRLFSASAAKPAGLGQL